MVVGVGGKRRVGVTGKGFALREGLVGLLGSCIGYGPSKMDGIVSL